MHKKWGVHSVNKIVIRLSDDLNQRATIVAQRMSVTKITVIRQTVEHMLNYLQHNELIPRRGAKGASTPVALSIPHEMHADLKRVAKARKVSVTYIIEIALLKYLPELEEKYHV